MNKDELKKVLKPLVKQCINEVLLEEGLLSTVIAEVMKGTGATRIVETKQPKQKQQIDNTAAQEAKRKQKQTETNKNKASEKSTISKLFWIKCAEHYQ